MILSDYLPIYKNGLYNNIKYQNILILALLYLKMITSRAATRTMASANILQKVRQFMAVNSKSTMLKLSNQTGDLRKKCIGVIRIDYGP